MGGGVTVINSELLSQVFGPDSSGETPEARARTSHRRFVRGQTMLAEASPKAKGRVLTATEAVRIFGFDVLRKAIHNGQAAIVPDRSEPARTIAARRDALGLPVDRLARLIGLKPGEITVAETPGKVSSIRVLEVLARNLAIDERKLGFDLERSADAALGVRFRRLVNPDEGQPVLSATAVVRLAEAAWVISRQDELLQDLGDEATVRRRFEPNSDYSFPAYEKGYILAAKTRELLGLTPDEPIPSLRRLIENVVRIPLVETELGTSLAGATIANGTHRGIVVNIQGRNENPWMRRMTLAHELGHLLWDPAERLESLMVDRYDEIEGVVRRAQDPVEIRANAFAVALLAPPHEVDRIIRANGGAWSAVVEVSERFGLSVTASRAHVQNVGRYQVSGRDMPQISDDWRAAENYTNDFFPLQKTPVSRRGRFAWAVLRAEAEGLVSSDTAASYLSCSVEDLERHRADVLQLTAP